MLCNRRNGVMYLLDIVCKTSFCILKCRFCQYMKGNWQLFFTFNEIMQQTFYKTDCEKDFFNINLQFGWNDIYWNKVLFSLMDLNIVYSRSDASFGIIADNWLNSARFIAWNLHFLLPHCLPLDYIYTYIYMTLEWLQI